MAGGDHDPGVGVEVAHGEGQHRRGHGPVEPADVDPGRAATAAVSAGEVVGAVAGVVADDTQRRASWPISAAGRQVVDQAGGGLADDQAVHAHRAGAQLGPQAGGAEREPPGEAVGEPSQRPRR